jgi:hypothetical protein
MQNQIDAKLHVIEVDWAANRQELIQTVFVHNFKIMTLNQNYIVFFSKEKDLCLLDFEKKLDNGGLQVIKLTKEQLMGTHD